MWREVLGREDVGLSDSFFDLGGDSITAIQIAAQFRTRGLEITPIELFRHPTVAELAATLARNGAEALAAAPVDDVTPLLHETEQYALTPLQQGLLFHCLSAPGERLYTSELVLTLGADFDPSAFAHAWQRIVDRHSIFRTAFRWDEDGEPV